MIRELKCTGSTPITLDSLDFTKQHPPVSPHDGNDAGGGQGAGDGDSVARSLHSALMLMNGTNNANDAAAPPPKVYWSGV